MIDKKDARDLAVGLGFSPDWIRAMELKYGPAVVKDAVEAVGTLGFTPGASAPFVAKCGPLAFAAMLDAEKNVRQNGDPAAFVAALLRINATIHEDVGRLRRREAGRLARLWAWLKKHCQRT